MSTSGWIGVVLGFSLIALLAWCIVPICVVRRFSLSNKEKADVEDNYRKTMGQALGAIALIATFGWTFYKDRDAIELSRDQFAAQAKQFLLQQNQARDQFINQQFIAAAGLLKEGSVSTRIAGLYAVEQIAAAKNEYLMPAIRAAIGFVKSPKDSKADGQPIAADIQSALSILGHLNENHLIDVDLHGTDLIHGDFKRPGTKAFIASDFQGARLYGADMSDLDLTSAKFGGSYMADSEAYGAEWKPSPEIYEGTRKQFTVNFDGAKLVNTNFDHVNMGGASLVKSCLAGASFYSTDLSRASLQNVDMGGGANCNSNGNKAHFFKAILVETNFDDVDIDGVSFEEANLSKARFLKAKNVDKAIFTGACADEKPVFPPSLDITLPRCPR
jgi:uncharacterized protein YjbI with pentapeptide repeats